MGIKRLASFIRPLFKECKLEEFSGKKIGIDGMAWIYQAFFSFGDYVDSNHLAMIRIFEKKIQILDDANIDYLFVIDGKELPCKKLNFEKKARKREQYLQRVANKKKTKSSNQQETDEDDDSVDNSSDENRFLKYSKYIDKDLKYFFIDYLKFKNIKYYVSPYEADSQLMYFYQTKMIDIIVTEDSDLIAYGCNHIINGVKFNGLCNYLDLTKAGNMKKYPNIQLFTKLRFLSSS